ncbi:MAG TPA: HDOD domain-containing protein [Chthonomonadaceae bacterium]|nr:HDOD domain-containing protein [Chthonomonadaceae bacterium]
MQYDARMTMSMDNYNQNEAQRMAERTRIVRTQELDTGYRPTQQTRLPLRGAGNHPPAQSGGGASRLPARSEPTPTGPVTLDSIVEQVRRLPALPDVAIQVMRMTGQETCSAQEIAQVISHDQSFAARILQLANSAYYGLPRNVGTISEAVVLLGMRTVRNMAIAAATHDTLSREVIGYELGRGDLWRHSLACAMASQMVAETARYPEAEEAFVAGLLHDIGKVVLSLHVRGMIALILERMEAENLSFLEAERAVLGFDHAEVGGRIAAKWNLPVPLVQAIAYHHQPVQNGQVAPLTAVVHIANVICLIAGIGLGIDGLRTSISSVALKTLNLGEPHIEKALCQLVTRVAQAQPLFEMENLLQAGGQKR